MKKLRANPQENVLYFLRKCFSHISGKWNSEKASYISRNNYKSSENEKKKPTLKKLLIFQEMELFYPKLKKILIYQEGTLKSKA